MFLLTTNGTITTLASFDNTNGAYPYGGLVQGSDGNFYGTTVNGGDSGSGTVFEMTTNGTLTNLVSFAGTNGANPYGALVQGNDGNFYGTTESGGSNGLGTVFMVTTNGTLTTLASFASTNGANPYGGSCFGKDGNFYGTTVSGGAYSNLQYYINPWLNGYGTVFMVTTNGALTSLYSFGAVTHDSGVPNDGGNPYGRLVLGTDGNLYGTTYTGGGCGFGTVYRITTDGSFTTLASFARNPKGANPNASLNRGSDGNFYGTTVNGGTNGYYDYLHGGSVSYGTVFKLATNGTFTTMASFAGTNGANPYGALIEGSDGNFYGTTVNGGSAGQGSVFMMTPNGVLTSLFSFSGGSDGANPHAGLIQTSDQNFYGTTANGGSSSAGTVFMMTPTGALTTLVTFTNANGANPYGALIEGGDGNLYGTTVGGGTNGGGGTVFMMTTNGNLSMLVSFLQVFAPGTTIWIWPNGGNPYDGLVQASDGKLYGTAASGALSGYNSFGTVFDVTTNGVLTTLYTFGSLNTGNASSLDGMQPYAGLVQGRDGNFYGTTYAGGPAYQPPVYSPYGTIFEVTTNGAFSSVYSFTGRSDGANPQAGLIQAVTGECMALP